MNYWEKKERERVSEEREQRLKWMWIDRGWLSSASVVGC